MTRKTCTTCNERKPIEDFPKNSRCSSGYENRCRSCKNSRSRRKVKCPNCDESYSKADLPKHMRTKKCIKGKNTQWKHPMPKNNQFKSNGQKLVKCPCKHDQCKVEIIEKTAYRHMKYGIRGKFSNGMEWKHPMNSKNRFKSNGKRYVICPCKHKQCSIKIREGSAYRHMKYGMDHKFPSDIKRIEDPVAWMKDL